MFYSLNLCFVFGVDKNFKTDKIASDGTIVFFTHDVVVCR